MLQLNVVLSDSYDETTSSFVIENWPLKLEHSLLSLSKWESKYEKPFLATTTKDPDEIRDYIQMMDLGENTPPKVFDKFSQKDFFDINEYINAGRTATWFTERDKGRKNSQVVTSELIYYWITSYEIPWVVETWHLNRLFTLIKVFNEERAAQDPKNKTARRTNSESMAEQRSRLNRERQASLKTTG